jgi:sigma-B regulation protein RsbU (phosphoserine phosphatase)
MPAMSGLDYYGECLPAAIPAVTAGGDFFDFVPLAGERLTIALGEVSGHGPGATPLMSGLQASLRGFSSTASGKTSLTVQALNKFVCELSPDDMYATLFYAHFDQSSRELRYSSAGHEPVLLVRRSPARVRHLESTGAVLGLTRRSEYGQRTIWLEPGDLLVAFSDGITDAADAEGREMCETGVLDVVRRCPDARAADLARLIMAEVDRFTNHVPPADDRTVVVARFRGALGETLREEHSLETAFAAA